MREQFAAAGSGMGGEAQHRIDPRQRAALPDMGEQLLDLGQREEQRVPQLLDLMWLQPSGRYPPLDLLDGS